MQIAVIAKAPVPGRVKTRLCPPFTLDEAAALARAALDDTLATVSRTPATRRVLVLDGDPGTWVPAGIEVVAQRGGDLAERLANAFADCAASCAEPIVLIGMDTPQVTVDHLARAGAHIDALARERDGRGAVLGPALDGGYWLIGLSAPAREVFDDVPMSEAGTCEHQVRRLGECGFGVELLDELVDIDTHLEATVVAERIPDSHFARRLSAIVAQALVP